MKKYRNLYILICLFCIIVSCNQTEQKQITNSDSIVETDSIQNESELSDTAIVNFKYAAKQGIILKPEGDYQQCRNQIEANRSNFYSLYQKTNKSEKSVIVEEAGNYLYKSLLNKIIPFWYHTHWNLSGTSNIPQQETVGCSYFTSNTLLACGFKLNRSRLAQTDPIAAAKSLTFSDSVIHYQAKNFNHNFDQFLLKNYQEGIYILGLDNHIGYLLIHKGNLYFIHSAYYYPNEVTIEYFNKSPGILGSSNYYLIPVSTNKKLIEKWILNEFIYIRKPEFMKVDKDWWDKQ